MRPQAEKAEAFRALHERPGAFMIPNPWDAGTAKLLASLGFEALATTSLGLANSLGRVDGTNTVSRGEVLENCRQIAAATDLPVNADLENGYADAPRAAAEMIRLAAEAGVVGGSIEDTTGDPAKPIYDFDLAVERVHAAVEMARSLPFRFVFTARADGLLHGRDLDDTIRRIRAFEKAGADVLYSPGVRDLATSYREAGDDEALFREICRHNLLINMLSDAASISEETLDIQAECVRRTRFNSRKVSAGGTLLGDLAALTAAGPPACRVRVLWGERDDSAFRPADVLIGEIRDAVGGTLDLHRIPRAGHWSAYENADEVNRLMLDFFAR